MKQQLIDKGAVINHLAVLQREDEDLYDIYETMKRIIRQMPTVEAVTAKEADALERRLKHLLKSEYIRQFDAVYSRSKEYILDIRDADKPVKNWIPCSERMPKEQQSVLAIVDGAVREARYFYGAFSGSSFYRDASEIEWWMPLPEPPKGGANNAGKDSGED